MKLLLSALVFLGFHATSAFAYVKLENGLTFQRLQSLSSHTMTVLHVYVPFADSGSYILVNPVNTDELLAGTADLSQVFSPCSPTACTINLYAQALGAAGHVGTSSYSSTLQGGVASGNIQDLLERLKSRYGSIENMKITLVVSERGAVQSKSFQFNVSDIAGE